MAWPKFEQKFENYRDKYDHVRLERSDGVLEVRVHSGGGSLKWCGLAHDELGFCFADIANDPENRVVIITGEGDAFCAEVDAASFGAFSARGMLHLHQAGMRLIDNLLAIPVPVIGAVNGAAHYHAELPLLSNIVIASDDASFMDLAHYALGIVPGDGVHVAWPALLGHTRASYFLLMDEKMGVEQARDFGIVHEIVPKTQLMDRAREVAGRIAGKPHMANRLSRQLLTHELKRLMHEGLSNGIAVECLVMLDEGEVG